MLKYILLLCLIALSSAHKFLDKKISQNLNCKKYYIKNLGTGLYLFHEQDESDTSKGDVVFVAGGKIRTWCLTDDLYILTSDGRALQFNPENVGIEYKYEFTTDKINNLGTQNQKWATTPIDQSKPDIVKIQNQMIGGTFNYLTYNRNKWGLDLSKYSWNDQFQNWKLEKAD